MDWNEIKSCRDFARYLNIPYKHLTYLLYNRKIDKLYESFEIPKKNGGIRIIQVSCKISATLYLVPIHCFPHKIKKRMATHY
ncbi:hypothetical protein, partial [Streptococcus sanguinis]|uniref:hypothetical protein n=1 Tax=Streptococcus sanguinis TaxID=1305 RepID=UPI001CBC69BB